MKKSAAILIGGGIGLWAVAFLPCRLLVGESALAQSLAALGLTLLPALATLLWAGWAFRNSAEMQLLAVLGGSFVRMALALGGAWILMRGYPGVFDSTLWFLLIFFYLGMLGLEIGALVGQVKRDTPAPAGPKS
ncbi:MAG: hypothetical protein U0793_25955 [Gemmataceae bacterium]